MKPIKAWGVMLASGKLWTRIEGAPFLFKTRREAERFTDQKKDDSLPVRATITVDDSEEGR
jgi:hypothetical protein